MEPTAPTSETAQTVWAYLKDWATPFAALIGVFAGGVLQHITAKAKIKSDERLADSRLTLEEKKELLLASVQSHSSETERFRALFDGYQEHIDVLRAEIHSLREEVHSLRAELSSRLKICIGCDKFSERQHEFWGLPHTTEPTNGAGA